MLKVLGRITSINVRKVTWLLDEIGTPYAREDWGGSFGSNRSPEFLAINPKGLMPVLVEDDFVLTESNAILRYLAARLGRDDLYPADLRARARIEEWLDFQATELVPAYRYAFLALARRVPGFDDPGQIETSRNSWNRQMGFVETQLARTGSYIAGEAFTIADIATGLAVNRWMRVPMEKPVLPMTEAYFARLRARPACQPYIGEGTD